MDALAAAVVTDTRVGVVRVVLVVVAAAVVVRFAGAAVVSE